MEYIFLFSGIVLWTFLEYVIHRFIGHQKKENNPVTVEHHRHHREGGYFAPAWKKLLLAIVVVSALTISVHLFAGWINGFAFAIGFSGMYLVYEAFHKILHLWAPLTLYGRWVRRHHFYHHFKNPAKNHGVTTPVWDIVFGTYAPVKMKLRVPQKMAMQWLKKTPDRFVQDYEIIYK